MFDDESTVKVGSKEILFKLSKNENYIESLHKFMNHLRKLIEGLGIEVTSIREENIVIGKNGKTVQLVLGIHGYDNFVRYRDTIGFTSKQKTNDLNTLLNTYQRFKLRDGRGQETIYNSLDKPKTIYSLIHQLDMTYTSIYKHLAKLRDNNLVETIKISRTKPEWRRKNDESFDGN